MHKDMEKNALLQVKNSKSAEEFHIPVRYNAIFTD